MAGGAVPPSAMGLHLVFRKHGMDMNKTPLNPDTAGTGRDFTPPVPRSLPVSGNRSLESIYGRFGLLTLLILIGCSGNPPESPPARVAVMKEIQELREIKHNIEDRIHDRDHRAVFLKRCDRVREELDRGDNQLEIVGREWTSMLRRAREQFINRCDAVDAKRRMFGT